ncbi:mitochondrial pyruvate carrier [Chloropicon roscoffensis]|uniref:Mitochondrial pyruvate carrier n=1 Tax=Chloropicon roscoffensis TaxID=1461544 RepID=A0AAX4PMF0_9CHLO|mmetsp:Transcript_5614/g.19481  ORF Transcript_5614/g.19481 Transcript_5614/m.19481 type:complete len:105 (+) Transcript_5614:119-433(+)
MASAAQQAKQFWNHPAGPKTIHFWAPTFKWGISLANVADFQSPIEKVSVPQQCAVALTGLIWTRFSTQIKPINYNLATVNFFMAMTGLYQLYRVASHKPKAPAE